MEKPWECFYGFLPGRTGEDQHHFHFHAMEFGGFIYVGVL